MILLSGILENIKTRKDKTVVLSLGSNEETPEKMGKLFSIANQHCYFAIKNEPFVEAELDVIKDLKTDFDNIKSKSQRLRAVLFVAWKSNSDGFEEFESYYQNKMEKFIDHVKTKIES
ncbi:MAG: hypothetical protein LC109_09350 [Bacteroidia bacterium]|nr:hypothetical protein [Bacteroidia bacterium]